MLRRFPPMERGVDEGSDMAASVFPDSPSPALLNVIAKLLFPLLFVAGAALGASAANLFVTITYHPPPAFSGPPPVVAAIKAAAPVAPAPILTVEPAVARPVKARRHSVNATSRMNSSPARVLAP